LAADEVVVSCSPNPVRGPTTFYFRLAKPSRVDLAVFDLAGRKVVTVAGGTFGEGENAVVRNAAGVPKGLYIYQLRAGNKVKAGMVFVDR
jgi:hypothetical protein